MRAEPDSTRTAVNLTAALLCVGALILIERVLSDSQYLGTSGKAIGTALAVALFGVLALPSLELTRRPSPLALFGSFGLAVALLGLIALVVTVWHLSLGGDRWHPAAYLAIVALANATCSALLATAREDDGDGIRVSRAGAIAVVVALVPVVLIEISDPGRDIGLKPIAVLAILFVLASLLTALLRLTAAARR